MNRLEDARGAASVMQQTFERLCSELGSLVPASGKALVRSTKHYGSWKIAIGSLPALRQHPLLGLVNYPQWKSQVATPALQAYFQNKSTLADLSNALSSGWATVNHH